MAATGRRERAPEEREAETAPEEREPEEREPEQREPEQRKPDKCEPEKPAPTAPTQETNATKRHEAERTVKRMLFCLSKFTIFFGIYTFLVGLLYTHIWTIYEGPRRTLVGVHAGFCFLSSIMEIVLWFAVHRKQKDVIKYAMYVSLVFSVISSPEDVIVLLMTDISLDTSGLLESLNTDSSLVQMTIVVKALLAMRTADALSPDCGTPFHRAKLERPQELAAHKKLHGRWYREGGFVTRPFSNGGCDGDEYDEKQHDEKIKIWPNKFETV